MISSVYLCHFQNNLSRLIELLATIVEARTLRKPDGDGNEAYDCKRECDVIVRVDIGSDEPELKGDVSHYESKYGEDVDSCRVLNRLWHHLYAVNICYIVATSLGNTAKEHENVQECQALVEEKGYYNSYVESEPDQEQRLASIDIRSSRQDE